MMGREVNAARKVDALHAFNLLGFKEKPRKTTKEMENGMVMPWRNTKAYKSKYIQTQEA